MLQGRRAERVLAHHQAVARDAVRQFTMVPGIDPVQAGADHRDGAGWPEQRTFVGCSVYAEGEA